MNIKKFWKLLQCLNEATDDEKRDRILDKYCNCEYDIKVFTEIYECYYYLLNQRYYNEWQYHDEEGIINMAEDTYYIFIAYLMTLGLKTIGFG